jgi:hypothetical protein
MKRLLQAWQKSYTVKYNLDRTMKLLFIQIEENIGEIAIQLRRAALY